MTDHSVLGKKKTKGERETERTRERAGGLPALPCHLHLRPHNNCYPSETRSITTATCKLQRKRLMDRTPDKTRDRLSRAMGCSRRWEGRRRKKKKGKWKKKASNVRGPRLQPAALMDPTDAFLTETKGEKTSCVNSPLFFFLSTSLAVNSRHRSGSSARS